MPTVFLIHRGGVSVLWTEDIFPHLKAVDIHAVSKKKSQMTVVDGKWWRWRWRYINDDMGRPGPNQSFAIKIWRVFFFFLPQREINQWTFRCTAAPANEGRIIDSHLELVLLTISQQIKTCTVTDYWHFRWVVEREQGCSAARLIGYLQAWLHSCSHELPLNSKWLSCEILQIELPKGKTPPGLLATALNVD